MASARGRLRSGRDAPAAGEKVVAVAAVKGAVVEQILSGRLDGPVAYRQDVDEWVVVLEGGAVLDVGDEIVRLGPGDWLLLPAGTAHRLVETTPGTSWLTVTATA
ncbi:MAG: cupin domain-containing protein [Acidimicrobiales bacterium]